MYLTFTDSSSLVYVNTFYLSCISFCCSRVNRKHNKTKLKAKLKLKRIRNRTEASEEHESESNSGSERTRKMR